MDYQLPDSSVPYSFIYDKLLSPAAIAVRGGFYDVYSGLADRLLVFARDNGVLPYDQTLGGRYIDYLLSFEDDDPNSAGSIAAERDVDLIYDVYNHLVEINDNAAAGAYLTPITIRGGTDATSDLSNFCTNHISEALVALVPTSSDILDVHGGSGHVVELAAKTLCRFNTYVNVGTTSYSRGANFDDNIRRISAVHDFRVGDAKYIHSDPAEFLAVHPHMGVTISIHGIYNVVDLVHHNKLYAVLHVSDLPFVDAPRIADKYCDVHYSAGLLTGTVHKHRITNERACFVDDFDVFYPARFFNSLRKSVLDSEYLSSSLGIVAPLMTVNHDIRPLKGVEFALSPSSEHYDFRRHKYHPLTMPDFYFLRKLGYYVSGSIDGTFGFVSLKSGVYVLTILSGHSFTITDPSGRPVNMGLIPDSINVEVLYNPRTGLFQLWYLAHSPPRYPAAPALKAAYWGFVFSPMAKRIELAKMTHKGLFFKRYVWVPSTCEKIEIDLDSPTCALGLLTPYVGVNFDDPYGNFSAYWRPYSTFTATLHGEEPRLFIDGVDVTVDDPNVCYVSPGVYELVRHNNTLTLLRPYLGVAEHKFVTDDTSCLFDYNDGLLSVDNLEVKFPIPDSEHFLDVYGRNHVALASILNFEVLDHSSVSVLYQQVLLQLVNARTYDGHYSVRDWVRAIRAKTSYDPQRLWSSFIKAGFIDPLYDPYNPVVKNYGEIISVIRVK